MGCYEFSCNSCYVLNLNVVGEGSVVYNGEELKSLNILPSSTNLSLNAQPNANWEFVNWSGDINSINNPESLLMNSDKDITVTFQKTPMRSKS